MGHNNYNTECMLLSVYELCFIFIYLFFIYLLIYLFIAERLTCKLHC